MGSPRVAIASGAAAAAAGALLVSGRVDGSLVLALALALGCRAAVASAAGVPRALTRQAGVVPAWIAIAIVAAVRAGSTDLGAMRGANAVAGLAIVRGEVLLVAAAWVAIVASALAIAYGSPRGGAYRGVAVAGAPLGRLDLVGIAVQTLLVVTMFAGPHLDAAADLIPWAAATVGLTAAVAAARRVAVWDRAGAAASALAAVAFVLALAGETP